jgi:hypothetical protein
VDAKQYEAFLVKNCIRKDKKKTVKEKVKHFYHHSDIKKAWGFYI